MKTRVFKLVNTVLGSVLALFGFAQLESCVCMYGAPYADIAVTGTVTDKADVPIAGIQVTDQFGIDTVYTAEDGRFSYEVTGILPEKQYLLRCTDVDGAENGGTFATDSVIVNLEYQDGKEWYKGKATADVQIKLKRKE